MILTQIASLQAPCSVAVREQSSCPFKASAKMTARIVNLPVEIIEMEQKRKEKLNCSIYECNSVSSHWGAHEQLSPTSMRLQLLLRPYSRWCSVGSSNWQRTIAPENLPRHLHWEWSHSSSIWMFTLVPVLVLPSHDQEKYSASHPSFASLMEETIVSAAQSGPNGFWDPFSFTSPIKAAPSGGPRLQKHLMTKCLAVPLFSVC